MSLRGHVLRLSAVFAIVTSLIAIMSVSGTAQEDVTVEEIIQDPEAFVGQIVTVTGTVGEIVTEQTFTLEGEAEPVGDEQLLVAGAGEVIPEELEAGETVQVTGEVAIVDPEDPVFEEIGVDPADPAVAAFEGGPVILTEAVEIAGAQATPETTPEATPEEATPEATPEATEAATPAAAEATPTPAPSPTPTPGQVAPVTGGPSDGGTSALVIAAIVLLGVAATAGGLLIRRAAQ